MSIRSEVALAIMDGIEIPVEYDGFIWFYMV